VNPVVMVFEDMQWADDSLLDFIDHLLEWSRSFPLFVCTLARPELHDRRPTWGAGRRNFTSLHLESLSGRAMEQLLSGLVPGLPEEVRGQILERAEGIPLYAVETVRMMLDRGVLVQDGPVYRPVGPIASLEVPETLHALIAARLDGLASEERRLLQDASVLGKTFTKRALTALLEISASELEPLLDSLVHKEMLGLQTDPRSPEHGQYSFLQDLVRYVAYETLSKQERRTRHLAAAAYLESAFGEEEEIVEVLASHYLDAYRAGPEVEGADEIKVKARQMLARAGERAASLAAAREGQRYFEQAAELADDALTRADLEDRAGRMAWRRGRAEEARAFFEQARSTFEDAGLTHPAARVSARLADIDGGEGHFAEAVGRLEEALQTLSTEEPDEDVAGVAAQLGRFLSLSGRYEEGAPHLELALELAEGLDLPEVFAQALASKSVVLMRRNRLEEARILLEGALARAVTDDFPAAAARASNNLAVVHESRDRYPEALAATQRGIEYARRIGDRVWEGQMLAGEISTLVLLGRWDEALERGAELEATDLLGIAYQLTHLVEVECWRGQVAQARARLGRHPALSDAEDVQSRSTYTVHEAMALRAEGKPRAALEALEHDLAQILDELGVRFLTVKLSLVEALESASDLGDTAKVEELLEIVERLHAGDRPPLLAAHAARFRARLAPTPAEAERELKRAAELFDDLGVVFWRAVTQLEHAEWLIQQDRAAEAQPLLDEAAGVFELLEATPWTERTRQALPQEREPEALIEPSLP
jgi:tetratricopeptide (TPR) repeat protein